MGIYLAVVLVLTILLQGGFFPMVYLLFGLISAIMVIVSCKQLPRWKETLLFGGICLLYILSAIINGFSLDLLTKAIRPLSYFMLWLIIMNLKHSEYDRLIKATSVISIIFALLAILFFISPYQPKGFVSANRLQFTFQYANAAGIYFASVALAVRGLDERRDYRIKRLIPVLEVAMLLTRSLGSIIAYGLGLLLAARLQDKTNVMISIYEGYIRLLFSGLFAMGIFICVVVFKLPAMAVLILAILCLFCQYVHRVIRYSFKHGGVYLLPTAFAAGLALLPFSKRLQQGEQTFYERLVQASDAIRALCTSMLTGIGPGNWDHLKGYWQTAQYTAGYVHSSYLQAGVDAGLPVLLIIGALLAFHIKKMKDQKPYLAAASFAILLHSTLDISMLFMPVVITLFLLGYDTEKTVKSFQIRRRVGIICFAAAGALLIGFCLRGQIVLQRADILANKGNYHEAAALLEKHESYLMDSYTGKYNLACYTYKDGKKEQALAIIEDTPFRTPRLLQLKAMILEDLGEYRMAVDAIFEAIGMAPHEISLYEHAQSLIQELPIDEQRVYKQLYDTYAYEANRNSSTLAAKLKNQKVIEVYNLRQ